MRPTHYTGSVEDTSIVTFSQSITKVHPIWKYFIDQPVFPPWIIACVRLLCFHLATVYLVCGRLIIWGEYLLEEMGKLWMEGCLNIMQGRLQQVTCLFLYLSMYLSVSNPWVTGDLNFNQNGNIINLFYWHCCTTQRAGLYYVP